MRSLLLTPGWTRGLLALGVAWVMASPTLAQSAAATAEAARAPASAAAAATTATAAGATPTVTTSSPKGPPAGFVAPAEPQPGDSNAARGLSQPGNNAPLWRAVQQSGTTPGYSSLPGAESGVLIQPFVQYPGSRYASAGEAWRQTRNQIILPYGGALLVIALLALAAMYWGRGPLHNHEPDTGRLVERFTPYERAVHWASAFSFVVLAVSGLVIAFGKFILLPVFGLTLFGWLSWLLKTAHNFIGPLFAVSLVLLILNFAKDNIPRAIDLQWLLRLGKAPSHRFNGAEKLMFWGAVCGLGLLSVASGLVLNKLVPGWGDTRGQMQIAHLVHAGAAIVMMAVLAGHIYMGTVGVRGALDGMRTGQVDESWAREHHPLWLDDVLAGKIPAQRSQARAAASGVVMTPAPRA